VALTREQLTRYIVDTFDVEEDEVGADTSLFGEGLLDSFELLELVKHLEAETGVRIEPLEVKLENLDTVARIERFLASKKTG
jgi:acyl carrier protein